MKEININDSVLKKVSSKTGIKTEDLKKNLKEGKTDDILKKLNPDDAKKISNIMKNPELANKILNSPQAKALIEKLSKK